MCRELRYIRIHFVVKSLLAVLAAASITLVCPAAEPEAKPAVNSTLVLSSREPDMTVEKPAAKLLIREIVRQAVLIAARDELGLSTRDATLRESMPAGAADSALQIDVQTAESSDKFVRFRLSLGGGDQAPPFYEKQIALTLTDPDVVDYVAFVAALEELSRTELVEALKKSGLEGKSNPLDASVKVPAGTERQLSEMNFLSQFTAIRELHGRQRSDGESAQTLAGLARGYAHLGQLTNFHWNASHKAFKARAMLYAQRLVHSNNKSPWSLRQRAYALALVGLHGAALADLKEARAPAAGDVSAPDSALAWEPVIEAYCRYDTKALEAPNDALRELAAYVSYLIVENSNSKSQSLTAGRRALEIAPECYAVCDSMIRYSGVINLHRTTVHGPQTLSQTLPRRLQEMPGLPVTVSSLLDRAAKAEDDGAPRASDPAWSDPVTRIALIEALVAEGDAGLGASEPSWELLGRLIEDVTFVHAYRRLEFFAAPLGLPRAALIEQARAAAALVAEHPLLPVIKCAVLSPQGEAQQIQRLCAAMHMNDAEIAMYPFVGRSWFGQPPDKTFGVNLWQAIQRHTDTIAQDLEQTGYYSQKGEYAHQLTSVSPHSPQGIALLIIYDGRYAQSRLKQWESDFGGHVVVLRALATRYLQLGQTSDAERCLRHYVELAPDSWGFESLANMYWQQKQPEKWKQTLDESLKHEDFALSHAQARVAIARYLMDRKAWPEAVVYADAAAESGASWALVCAAECHEALEQWESAEQLMRTTGERYGNDRLLWYFWCRRTGHGDVAAAQKLAAIYIAQLSANPNVPLDAVGVYHILSQKNDLAQAAFKRTFDRLGNPYSGIHFALLADEAGQTEVRDAALADAVDRGQRLRNGPGGQPPTLDIAMAKWLNNAYHQPADTEPALDALDDLLKVADKAAQANVAYFSGRYFKLRGKADLATRYLQRAIDTGVASNWNRTLACTLLRETPAEKEKPAEGEK
jgi:tetratricopeptide (TPR) repeat protein